MDNEKPMSSPEFERLLTEMRTGANLVLQRLDQMEARILRAFKNIAESIDLRLTQRELNRAMFMERFAAIESRLLAVEKRLDMPPSM